MSYYRSSYLQIWCRVLLLGVVSRRDTLDGITISYGVESRYACDPTLPVLHCGQHDVYVVAKCEKVSQILAEISCVLRQVCIDVLLCTAQEQHLSRFAWITIGWYIWPLCV
jgi:hypothetical protein